MWTSDRRKTRQAGESWVDWGEVTLEGDPAGAYLDGERRQLAVYGPGGYCWKPALGDRVLVLKAGQGGESPCVAGKRQGEAETLGAGEVSISSTAPAFKWHSVTGSMERRPAPLPVPTCFSR